MSKSKTLAITSPNGDVIRFESKEEAVKYLGEHIYDFFIDSIHNKRRDMKFMIHKVYDDEVILQKIEHKDQNPLGRPEKPVILRHKRTGEILTEPSQLAMAKRLRVTPILMSLYIRGLYVSRQNVLHEYEILSGGTPSGRTSSAKKP